MRTQNFNKIYEQETTYTVNVNKKRRDMEQKSGRRVPENGFKN